MNGFSDVTDISLKLSDHVRMSNCVLNVGIPDYFDEKLSCFFLLVGFMEKVKEEVTFKI